MRKMIVVVAVLGTLCAVGNASACNDIKFLDQMGNVNKQVLKGNTSAQHGSYRLGRDYTLVAKRMFGSVTIPCNASLKLAKAQYAVMLDYDMRGMNQAVAGNFASAIVYIRQGTIWMNKATASINAAY